MRALALVLLAVLATPAAAEGQKPTFDCAGARGEAERAICADPALAALDRAVSEAYAAALRRLSPDPKAAARLREEQQLFNDSRDWASGEGVRGLKPTLEGRTRELDAIVPPRPGFEGRWLMSDGSVDISRGRDGRLRVKVEVDPGAYRCEFNGLGVLKGGRMTVSWNVAEDVEDGAEGWTLELRREGGVLAMAERRNRSEAERPPYCGARGGLDGMRFLPAKPRAG